MSATERHVAEAGVGPARPLGGSATGQARPDSRYSVKFRTALAVLVAVGIVSIAVALSLSMFGGGRSSSGPAWSAWRPPDNGLAGAQEIADYLSPYYRATPGYQLAIVTTMDLNNPGNPQVVIPSASAPSGVAALSPSNTVAYTLCGLGSRDCSIGVGTPSMDRLLLLRREALELALYTFKYVSGATNVVAILPPGRSAAQTCTGICPKPHAVRTTSTVDLAIAFDRSQLAPWLNQPLRSLLPEDLPPTVAQIATAPEAELVSIVTSHAIFQEHIEQTQSGGNLIVLNPQPSQ